MSPTEDVMAHAALIARFYAAFGRLDYQAMISCYAPAVHFSDPVFGDLHGAKVGQMWQMLCERATDLRVECGPVRIASDRCGVEWQAWYTYSATGRVVHNIVAATFVFEHGLIRRHDDVFSLYRWARQALGLPGILLGWTPPVQQKIRTQATRALDAYAKRSAGLSSV